MRSVAILLGLLAACHVSPKLQRAQAIYDLRERTLRTVDPSQAVSLAMAVHAAHEAGDYAGNLAQLQSDALSALAALEQARVSGDPYEPTLYAWRGIVFEDVGQLGEARIELERSFELQPYWLAGQHLVAIYTHIRERARLEATCKALYPTLQRLEQQLAHITACKTGIASMAPPGEALAWLEPNVAAWYAREMERRDHRADAEQEQRRVQQERAARVARYVERCSAACRDQGIACQDACTPGDARCIGACEARYDGCLDRCEAAAKAWLTTPPATTRPPAQGAARRTGPSARAGAPA